MRDQQGTTARESAWLVERMAGNTNAPPLAGPEGVPPVTHQAEPASDAETEALDVEAIRQRCEGASPGPWAVETCGEKGDGSDVVGIVFGPDDEDCAQPLSGDLPACDDDGEPIDYYRDEIVAEFHHHNRRPHADALFVAHARSDIPALLAEVESLRARLAAPKGVEPLGWQACPVCGGRGVVPHNFYGDANSGTSVQINERCRTCINGVVNSPSVGARATPVGGDLCCVTEGAACTSGDPCVCCASRSAARTLGWNEAEGWGSAPDAI